MASRVLTITAEPRELGTIVFLQLAIGNSTNLHLNIHSIQGTAPWTGPTRPLPFQDIHVVDRTLVHPSDAAENRRQRRTTFDTKGGEYAHGGQGEGTEFREECQKVQARPDSGANV